MNKFIKVSQTPQDLATSVQQLLVGGADLFTVGGVLTGNVAGMVAAQ